MNPDVDLYLEDGCGRCKLYKTPLCKVHNWVPELRELRRMVLDCGLEEEFKWSQPCYTFREKNVIIATALKDCAVLAFFKGVLLKDAEQLLVAPGKHSQSDRQFRFTSLQQIRDMEATVKAYIYEALEIEKAGTEVELKKELEPLPEELIQRFGEEPALEVAFKALTPGRQRGYILHFSQAKQSATRLSRIEKCRTKIMHGKGFHDR